MTCGVYSIHNKQDDTIYIGQSQNIENRWKAHNYAPSNNMVETVMLSQSHEDLVDYNIICPINPADYTDEELKFVLNSCEQIMLDKYGGHMSPKTLNKVRVPIAPVSPSILKKRDVLPKCISDEEICDSINTWHMHKISTMKWGYERKLKQQKEDAIHQFEEYRSKIRELKNSLGASNSNCDSWFKAYQSLSLDCQNIKKQNEELSYKINALSKNITILNDENTDLSKRNGQLISEVTILNDENTKLKDETSKLKCEMEELSFWDIIKRKLGWCE